MIPNPIFYNDHTIMIGLVVCCVVILAIVMIPKAIRHRKQVRESKSENSTSDEEQELEMIVVPSKGSIPEKSANDYKKRFLVNAEITARTGKSVYIRKKYHDRISKIVRVIGENETTIFSYVDNVLNHHFETFQDEITELYNKNNKDIF